MKLALQGLQCNTCLICIDDIIVYGRNIDEHMRRVEEVFQRLRHAGLNLKPESYDMLKPEVVFLGHVVSAEGTKPNPTSITNKLGWPKPKNAKQAKQLVAMGSYYRRYVKNFAALVRPMVELTGKGKKFIWSEACEKFLEGQEVTSEYRYHEMSFK